MQTRKDLRAQKERELTYVLATAEWAYDAATGVITKRATGEVVGGRQNTGYGYGQVRWSQNGKSYAAHRLAWLLETGAWPTGYVDHANNDHGDNRFENLRDCTQSQNLGNQRRRITSKSGVKGVYWDTRRAKWHAQIAVNGKSRTLGRFDSKDDAATAYAKAAHETFGEFARLA